MLFTIINSITVAVHLIDCIRWRIISSWQICHFDNILFLKVFVKLLVVDDTILRIIQIGQDNFARCLANIKHNVWTLLCCRRINTHTILIFITCAVKRMLVMKGNHVTLMCSKLCLAFFRIIILCFWITIFYNMFQRRICKWIE